MVAKFLKNMVSKRLYWFAGVAVLVAATTASALSLGRVRGTALIGRALDLSVMAGVEPGEATPEANCFAAEVFYGDTRVSPASVNITPERSSGGEMRIRVRSNIAVDEPVVTLFIRQSCGSSVSRRYVLLAEALSESEAIGATAIQINPASATGTAAPVVSPRIAFGGATGGVDGAAEERASARRAQRQAQKDASSERRVRRANQAQVSESRPSRPAPVVKAPAERKERQSIMRQSAEPSASRLKIDLLEATSANLNLRGSAEMASAPSTDAAVRAQAQALWRTLNASPEEALRDAQRLETIDAQLRLAQAQTKRQGQDITTLSTQLQTAQSERYINPLTIGLGLLSLAALGLAALFWTRSRRVIEQSDGAAQPWWRGNAAKAKPQDEQHLWTHLADGSESAMQPLQKAGGTLTSSAVQPSKISGDDVTRAEFDEMGGAGSLAWRGEHALSRFDEKSNDLPDPKPAAIKPSFSGAKTQANQASIRADRDSSVGRTGGPSASINPSASRGSRSAFGNTDFGASTLGSGLGALGVSRVVAAEELFDIQEQADFFLSLGQPDQAVEVLKNHITDNVETSALAYMDLFNIYHKTNRKNDYAELREEFNRVFNAQVPWFDAYGAQSNGLEDFPQVLRPIQASWARPHEAQDVIEESIFRQPEQDQTLDMAAYRELMLLYALAKELSRPDAAYSMLPISTQTSPLAGQSSGESANVDLGDGLVFSSPIDDLISPDDRTVSLPHPLVSSSPSKANNDGSLDFDLSDAAPLSLAKSAIRKK